MIMIVGAQGISNCSLLLSSRITCCSQSQSQSQSQNHDHDYKIPKLEPFSRSKFDRALKDPPLINKSLSQLADYCTVLEGDSSYSCWQAYFELKDLQKEYSKEQIEKLIIEAGGVKSLIGCLHGVAAIRKASKQRDTQNNTQMEQQQQQQQSAPAVHHSHIPDGLPKTAQEIEEEEKGKMPDSAYTRLLRLRGTHPAWYSLPPDHQTD